MRRLALLPAILLLILACPPARADVVMIQSSVTVTAGPGELTATAMVANVGDASAYDLIARMAIMDLRLTSPEQRELPPQESFTFAFSREITDMPAGSFPLALLMQYTDETGYPLSALHCGTFDTPGAKEARIEAGCEKADIVDQAKISAWVENRSDRAIDVSAACYLPREFTCPERRSVFILRPGERQTADFTIKNLTALPGSSHAVFVSFQYDEDYVHYTKMAQGTVRVLERRGFFSLGRNLWKILFGVIAALFLALLAFRLARRRKAG